ncbi:MAG: glycosyltransferase [Paludibacter sp.]
MSNLSILHNVCCVGKASYGLGQISVSLARDQYQLGHDTNIWCLENDEDILWASRIHDYPLERLTGFKLLGPVQLYFSPKIIKRANSCESQLFDIVHQHGLWTGSSSATRIFSKYNKAKTIIAPHGTLSEWSLNVSTWKKKIALKAFELENLKLASCLHATSENEISDFRNFGLTNPIAYIENGINEDKLKILGNANRFRENFQIDANKRILLYMSRITPKKGLLMLVEAIKTIEFDFDNWQLVIVGNDEFNHKVEVENLIKELKLENSVRFIHPLYGADKEDIFAATELFILPTYSEGFPMVVLDSLAAGIPVITTFASSWNDLILYNCGWWTDINTQAISAALRESVNMSSSDLKRMGGNGKKLISNKYIWPQLAQKTIHLYDWLLGKEDKPDFVYID